MSIWVSIILITLCATAWDAGVVFQKQAADRLPPMTMGRELPRTLWAFVTSGRWMLGLALSAGGWGLWAYALTFTPISLARAIQGSGLVVLAVFSVLFLNHRLQAREWIAVIIVTGGIVLLGISEPQNQQTVSVIVPVKLALAVGIALAGCLLVYGLRAWLHTGFSWVVVFSVVSGVLAGLGDVFTRTLDVSLAAKAWLQALAVMLPALSVFYISQILLLSRAYQHGRAIVAIGVNDFSARVLAIFVGILALGESFPADPRLKLYRIIGLATVLIGTVLLARFSAEQFIEDKDKVP
jgi:drug/metabolite transporter (DMT)-like permease